MNRTQNPGTPAVEARLERSLRHQVRVPKLDGRFDAAVWARIEAEKVRAVGVPRPASAASRWMFATNVVGALVTAALVIFFGLRAFTGSDIDVPIPVVSPGLVEQLVAMLMWPVTLIAIAVGVMFTPLGRRLRAELG
jgi:hypothetical protein